MNQYKITNSNMKVLDGRPEALDHGNLWFYLNTKKKLFLIVVNLSIELNDAALKSLDLEDFSKKKALDEYREGFKEDYNYKQQMKFTEKMKEQRDKEEYIKMCVGRKFFDKIISFLCFCD